MFRSFPAAGVEYSRADSRPPKIQKLRRVGKASAMPRRSDALKRLSIQGVAERLPVEPDFRGLDTVAPWG
jgi:hypothetical protein